MPPLRRSSAKVARIEGILHGPRRDPLEDEARFLRSWFERPLVTGAVTPSGKMLARTMASYVDPHQDGPVIELGPGTGPVTEALIRRGVAPERLILVEFNPDFCRLLARRFPGVTVIRGDAYDMRATLGSALAQPGAATISSLPLFTKPLEQRLDLLNAAHDLMRPGAPSCSSPTRWCRRSRPSARPAATRQRRPIGCGSTCRPLGCGCIGGRNGDFPSPLRGGEKIYPNCSLRIRSSKLCPGSCSSTRPVLLSSDVSTEQTRRNSVWSATAATGRWAASSTSMWMRA